MAKNRKSRTARRTGSFAGATGVLALLVILAAALMLLSSMSESAGNGKASSFNVRATARSDVRINEVMASNASALVLPDGTLPDWIELYNAGGSDVSLKDYILMRGDDPKRMYRLGDVTIPANGYLLVYADEGEDAPDELHASFRIPASGEKLVLMNAAGNAVDVVQTPELKRNQVYRREDDGEWRVSDIFTPGAANGDTIASIAEHSMAGKVIVTEVMTRCVSYGPDAGGACSDYVELHNATDEEISLKDWYLSDSRDELARWQFPDVSIPAGGYLLVHCSGQRAAGDSRNLHAGFRLSGDGTDVVLSTHSGETVASLTVPELEKDRAYSLIDGEWTDAFSPTPGRANDLDGARAATESLQSANAEHVFITELGASTSQMDSDWLELYNAGSETVDLSGYGLSDNPGRPRKWQFPAGTVIAPGEYLGVLMSGLETAPDGHLHASFKLTMAGDYFLSLSRPDGTIIDRTYVPRQYQDVSYGRAPGEDGFFYFAEPTPLAANSGDRYADRAQPAQYSVSGGLFMTGETFSVELTARPGERIYYTLDSSEPTEESNLYTGPIPISETTILRTRVYADGCMASYMDAQSYLYDVNNAGVYVVSLVSDPYYLVSEEAGMLVKGSNAEERFPYLGANYWMDWEYEGHVEIYDGDGKALLSQECGLKVAGNYSRGLPQKGLKVIARSRYGSNRFEADLFSDRDYGEYQSFLLRSAGQDTNWTRMRDSILSELAADTSVMYQETEICVVYLDGEYYGQYNLRERVNPESICQFEGWEGDEKCLDVVRRDDQVMHGSNESFEQLLEWIRKQDPNSEGFYETVAGQIDIQNYIEFMAIQLYVGNRDTANIKRYRNANADGKWRWILFDLDNAFLVDTDSISMWLNDGGAGIENNTDNTLFIAMMSNDRFRDEFLTHMGQRMTTQFTADYVLSLIEERLEVLEPLLDDQFERWGPGREPFEKSVELLKQYAEERPWRLLDYFEDCEELGMSHEELGPYFDAAVQLVLERGS